MNDTKLVTMLNQIADFHRRRPRDEAVREIAQHLTRYWERRMRDAITAHVAAGGAGLTENAVLAVRSLEETVR